MKFRMISIPRDTYPEYPYDYRIELVEYGLDERNRLTEWLRELNVPHTQIGTGKLWLREREAILFALKWS